MFINYWGSQWRGGPRHVFPALVSNTTTLFVSVLSLWQKEEKKNLSGNIFLLLGSEISVLAWLATTLFLGGGQEAETPDKWIRDELLHPKCTLPVICFTHPDSTSKRFDYLSIMPWNYESIRWLGQSLRDAFTSWWLGLQALPRGPFRRQFIKKP